MITISSKVSSEAYVERGSLPVVYQKLKLAVNNFI